MEQQADLQRLRDQHAAQLAEKCDQTTVQLATTLTQVTHQMEQLRTQVSARLYSGELVTPGTPGAATDSPALEPVHGTQPAPAPPSQPPPIPSEARPTSTGRWSNVNLDLINSGSARAPPVHDTAFPPGNTPADNMEIDRYLLKLRNTNTPTVLRTVDRKAVIKFYNAFADFL